MSVPGPIDVPAALVEAHRGYREPEGGPAWVSALPALADRFLRRWQLRVCGAARHGAVSLVLPVTRVDGTPAALKFQPVNDESVGEPDALRMWNGDGAVRLLEHDPATGTLLLEWLDATRPLSVLPDEMVAVRTLAELMARLVAVPAPPDLRRLGDIAAAMLAEVPRALPLLRSPDDRRRLRTCASAMAEVITEPGEQLLHWDLHYDNILAAEREPWLAIDPKPLAGDPGFELLPALGNRWEDIEASSDADRAILRRFDLMVDTLALDRQRAVGWTLGRVLQNILWDVQGDATAFDSAQARIADALLRRPRRRAAEAGSGAS